MRYLLLTVFAQRFAVLFEQIRGYSAEHKFRVFGKLLLLLFKEVEPLLQCCTLGVERAQLLLLGIDCLVELLLLCLGFVIILLLFGLEFLAKFMLFVLNDSVEFLLLGLHFAVRKKEQRAKYSDNHNKNDGDKYIHNIIKKCVM